ncbi:uncharacterized protein TRAVEDRAFT_70903 [Trametes versicolor FP-101664 SS1]|uniref:uncharacterized protein n=1 Tax=Trametes versicolor (strain FP-101664) TaxID=717944 RepID=UPI00046245BF|nr:uncharacterized protein TRAVEDRAFT_70903 [Trametes versicolor FP-101664 SS1]EIW60545.1 hypothetical protein TRAVEDRAFT_70903 [Trametes versicolor FP-101664 SS1]
MGNSASSGRGHHEEMVDFGYLTPQGIYTGPRDWNQAVVNQLIVDRKLAPFYRPLEDYEEDWDDEQILAARKEPPEVEGGETSRAESISSAVSRGHQKRPSAVKEPTRHPEAAIYRGAAECPICFLYYPPNINHSRCCHQAICTECFVQIKRADPTTTHLVSEPASCPYCVQENFGVVYTPPPWRAGLGSEGATPPSWPDSPRGTSQQSLDAAANPSMKRRRKSFGANDPEVVTVDQIHPDWEAKLAAVRAAVARRANRRIIMRQVGDRLIPVGVTSGRVHALPPEEGAAAEVQEGSSDRGSRRSRRRQQNQELNQFLGTMGLGGQDLEELMVMEAMRLSLIEHEAQQRRQEEEDAKKQKEAAAPATAGSTVLATAGAAAGSTASAASSQPTPNISTPTALRPSNVNAISRSATPTPSIPPASPSPAPSGPSSPPALGNDDQQSGSSPSPHQDVTDHAVTESLAPVAEPGLASASTALAQSRPRTPVSPASLPVISEPSSIGQDSGSTPSLPPIARVSSLSSSLAPSSYDVLPSTPDSTLSMSNIPLLDSTPVTPAAEGDSSSAPAS